MVLASEQAGVAEPDRAAGRLVETEDGPRQGGLAATALADDGNDLTGVHVQVHAIDRVHNRPRATEPATADGEVHFEVPDLKERRHVRSSS